MKKIEMLSELFKKNSSVLIVCENQDLKDVYDELSEYSKNSIQSVFKNENALKSGFVSVAMNGVTFHFGNQQSLQNLIDG